jgi:hypothetical protein
MEPDLIVGLAKLSEREHLSVSALVRRAIRRELELEGVLTPERHTSAKTGRRKRKTKTS